MTIAAGLPAEGGEDTTAMEAAGDEHVTIRTAMATAAAGRGAGDGAPKPALAGPVENAEQAKEAG